MAARKLGVPPPCPAVPAIAPAAPSRIFLGKIRSSGAEVGALNGCSRQSVTGDGSSEKTPEEPFWKWRLVMSYDGTKYAGWQLQQRPPTVQRMLEDTLTKVTQLPRETMVLTAASRTDTGVHAWGQVAHFQTPFPLEELQSLHSSLNGLLPNDIRIREVAAVQQQFHARYSAQKKTYQYKVYTGPVLDPFQCCYALHVRQELNVDAMREAAKYFVGQHDFMAFANVSKQVRTKGFIREIYRFEVIEKETNLLFEVEGSGFFYKQVRNMVGLLLEIGKELVPATAVYKILASQSRTLLSKYAPSAPPHGLFLMCISYDRALLEPPLGSPRSSYGLLQKARKCKVFF